MSDVAQAAGVSAITVSRALHHPDKVTQQTRDAVAAAMAGLGYVPNLIAGGLAATQTRMVGVIVPYIAHGVFADAVQGLGDVLDSAGYCVLLGNSGGSVGSEEAIVRMLLGHRPAGIVIQGANHSDATRRMLRNARIPVVEMGTLPETPIHCAVGYSNFQAARHMTAFLAGRGRRRIAFMSAPPGENDRAAARLAGFRTALREAGLRFDPHLVIHAPFGMEEGRTALATFLQRRRPPDAVFCGSDLWAAGMIAECRRRGIAVPEDLSIAGFNDQEIAPQTQPAITTIRVPRYQIGRCSGQLILDHLRGRDPAQKVLDLGFELVVREST